MVCDSEDSVVDSTIHKELHGPKVLINDEQEDSECSEIKDNKDIDYIYREELEKYEADGVLKLHTAFSRDQGQKVYVTHRLRENAAEFWRLIGEENAHFYICGDAKMMAKDVHDIVTDIVRDHGGKTQEEAEAYVKKMEAQKRYSADVWS